MATSTPCSPSSWRTAALLLERQARRARQSINEFAEFAVAEPRGARLRQATIHRELQQFLTEHPRALIELPRDHGKSVQTCIRILWELGRRPDLRVKIICANSALAAERSRFLRDAIAGNRRVRLIFPHLRPSKPWSAERFSIQRPANTIGPSVAAFGIGAGSTGSRADLLVCDDIVDVKSIASRSQRERVKSYFRDNLVNLLEPDGRLWSIFTPWHHDDLNAELKRVESYAHFRRAIDDQMTPIWPEKWPRDKLEERRAEIGSHSFARAYRLLPLPPDEMPIRQEWIQFFAGAFDYSQCVLAVDPAVSRKQSADRTALVILGRTSDQQIHCLEAIARRLSMPKLLELMDELDRRWNPSVIAFETNAAFAGIAEMLRRQTQFGPKIRDVTQSRDKLSRVYAFSHYVENGTFRLRGLGGQVDRDQQELFDEMISFPLGEHDDLLDAAAFGAEELLRRRDLYLGPEE